MLASQIAEHHEDNMAIRVLVLLVSSAVVFCGAACKSSAKPENTNSGLNANNNAPSSGGGVLHFRIDPSQSQFTARIGVSGVLSALGHDHVVAIRDFAGEAQITQGTLEPGSLQLTIKAASLAETEKEFSDSDRQKIDQAIHNEALEVAKYPEIVFKSTNVSAKKTGEGQFDVQIEGELTLHGVTRPINVPAQVSVTDNTITARGQFTVRHSDYQMKRISAGAGMVTAKDDMALSFNITGVKT
jgi:polyisoprenoid-binding protein YceI